MVRVLTSVNIKQHYIHFICMHYILMTIATFNFIIVWFYFAVFVPLYFCILCCCLCVVRCLTVVFVSEFERLGGQLILKKLQSLSEIPSIVPDVNFIVNASGLGAATLVKDEAMFPVAGHIVKVTYNIHIIQSRFNIYHTFIVPKEWIDIVIHWYTKMSRTYRCMWCLLFFLCLIPGSLS